ncbi:hypothetical protein MHF_0734 [Mycoplasma haemofelis Ohio2]|uniref:Uncharacterized protein n=1 Tax=Mycoplasma haemofelis (strain Ohio2) TaxID=859194 RepID=F6FIF6_MYCHI|nr:hypothetical protein MHF_0734 [Mycoplasma haemofelis Ohio2]
MSSSIAKSLTTSATVAVISGVGFKTVDTLFKRPTNKAHLESQNYKSLFEVRRNPFTRWREKYLNYKKELEEIIPEISSDSSSNEGAYFLKRWCHRNMYESYDAQKMDTFNQLKVFCTMDIKAFLLEEEDTQTIDDMKESSENKNAIFHKYKDSIMREGILQRGDNFDNLLTWCKSTFKETYKSEKKKTINRAQEFCLTPESKILR